MDGCYTKLEYGLHYHITPFSVIIESMQIDTKHMHMIKFIGG